MIQKGDFDAWLMSQMDLSTPEKMEYWRTKFPDIFQAREELWRQNQDLITQAALINMRGPISRDDYLFLYMLSRGYINLPDVPSYQPESVRSDTTFTRGMFSFYRMLPWVNSDNTSAPVAKTAVGKIDWKNPLNKFDGGGAVTFLPGGDAALGEDAELARFYGQIPKPYGFPGARIKK
jgi:hypothetical protein